jgi:hypothetical protein
LEPSQFEYEKHLNRKSVRGDVGLASAPRPLGSDSLDKRTLERDSLLAIIQTSGYFDRMKSIEDALLSLERQSLLRAHRSSHVLDVILGIDVDPVRADSAGAAPTGR